MKMIRLARALLVVLVVVVAAVYLPQVYWLAFDVNLRPPRVMYSPVLEKFMFMRVGDRDMQYSDATGKTYTREESERLNPLLNYRQLAATGAMPDSLRGVALDLKQVGLNNISMRIFRGTMDAPAPSLFPLFESQSGRLRLEMPVEMFRIASAMEFITASTNTIDTGKTHRFTRSLTDAGFTFPATEIAGNPTTLKQFDEGYFVRDARGRVFHIKKIRGEPYCRDISIPETLRVRKMYIQEMPLREFYGMMITADRSVYLISYDQYALIKVPLIGYDPATMDITFSGDLFFRTITAVSPAGLHTVVTDRDYEVVARYDESWPTREQLTPGIVASYLFPFTISLTDPGSLYVRPFVKWSGLEGAVGILVSLGLMILIFRVRKIPLSARWFDIAVVACSGIFGLLATMLIESLEGNE